MGSIIEHTIFPPHTTPAILARLSAALERQERASIVSPDGERIELPIELSNVLIDVARALAEGQAVTVARHNTVLTTQEAADLLGVSRPTLVRMLNAGQIPHEQPGKHRRIRLDDLIQYQQRVHARRRAVLDEMLNDSGQDPDLQHIDNFTQTR